MTATLAAIKCKVTRNDNGTWNVFGVPSFMTHTRDGMRYDRAKLDQIILNTTRSDRIKGQPKIIIHHSGGYTGPNLGRMRNLRRVEDVILADYTNLRPAVFSNWHQDGYPGRSVQLDPRTLDRIEAVALLGDEEPYFTLSPIAFDLTSEQQAQLAADVEADKAFAHAYSRKGTKMPKKLYIKRDAAAKLAKALLENKDTDSIALEQLFTREEGGELKEYMLEPDDAQDVMMMVEEAVMPIKEGLSMLVTRLESVEAAVSTMAQAGGAQKSEGGDEDSEESDGSDDADTGEDDTEENFEKGDEEPPKKDEDPSKNSRPDLAAFERLVKTEAENARLKGSTTLDEYKRQIIEVLDPSMYAEPEKEAARLAADIMKMPKDARAKALEIVLGAYQQGGVPTGKLAEGKKQPKTTKALEKSAREYHRAYKKSQGAKYLGMKEDDFVKHVVKTVEDDPETERFAFLRTE